MDKFKRSLARELLRWYLKNFPLRDGKGFCYQKFNEALAPAERHVIMPVAHGFSLRLDLWEPAQRKIYFYGSYDERHEIKLVQRVLERGEIFWDVGANIGYFSLAAAAALKNTGQVAAFEPGEAAYRSLLVNIALNPFGNIRPYQVAASDLEGEGFLYLGGEYADGGATLYIQEGRVRRRQSCRMVKLDCFSQEVGLAGPDFIKMDIEGAEPAALRGSTEILALHRPLLLVEMKEATLQAAGSDKNEVQELLGSFGYRPAFLHKGKWLTTDEVQTVRSRNIFWFNPLWQKHRRKAGLIPVVGVEK